MPSQEYLIRKRKYICEHRRKNYKTMTIAFRFDSEQEYIDYLDAKPSRQKFIKDAIIAAIESEKNQK